MHMEAMAEDMETTFASSTATSSYGGGPISVDHWVEDVVQSDSARHEEDNGNVLMGDTETANPTTGTADFNGFLDFLNTPTPSEHDTPTPSEHEELVEWSVEDEEGNEVPPPSSPLSIPPQSLFQVDGHLSNVQMNTARTNVHTVEQKECDDSSAIFEADGDSLLDGSDEEIGHTEAMTSVVDKAIFPTFNSNGNFVGYEARGNQDTQNSDHDVSQARKSNKKYAIMLSLLLFSVAIVSVVYLAGGNRRSSTTSSEQPVGHEVIDFSEIAAAANGTPSQHHHAHSQKEHTLRHTDSPTSGPTKMSTKVYHTHPKKDHAPRNSESPTASPLVAHAWTTLADYESVFSSSYQRSIAPIAVATIKKSHPDDEWGGLEELAVERDERISFLRFGLSSIAV